MEGKSPCTPITLLLEDFELGQLIDSAFVA